MPQRTGPRRKRPKASAPRHFVIVHGAAWVGIATAHRIELDGGHLVLRDHNDTISRVVAPGRWQEIRPATISDLPLPAENPAVTSGTIRGAENPAVVESAKPEDREQATLVNENDPAIPLEPDRRFVPSSPEEAQRILMELERRLDPDAPPAPLPRKE